MAENLVKSNPKTYFNFPSCITCFQKPCERLRYGGVYPGKFIIVHSREYSFTNCHFSAASIDEVGQLLSNLQVHDFTYEIGKIISLMSPAEQIHWNMDHLVTGYSDWAGYLEFIQPVGSELTSGYRDAAEQRIQLYNKYHIFKGKIEPVYGKDIWEKNDKKAKENLDESERDKLDIEMHNQICEAVSHKEVALPGKSLHQKGRAIDVGGTSDRLERIRALAYYLIKFENTAFVSAVNNETNCVHFEFD